MDKKEKIQSHEEEKVLVKSGNTEPVKFKEASNFIGQELKKNKGLVIALLVLGLGALIYNYKSLFIAATVQGKPIFRWEVTKVLETQLGEQALNNLIEKRLIANEAVSKNIVISEDEINLKIKSIEDGIVQSGQTMDQFLAQNGMSQTEFRDQVKHIALIEKLLQDKVTVTEEEITAYIEENKESFPEIADDPQGRSLVKESLQQNKMSQMYGSYIDELKTTGNVNVLVKY
ncbi:MAG: Parvulin-like protein peptidyl-prolyl isomerase [candidate division WWE3 bacterium GW2011_GWF2_41_45]|uniref:SurA N-terminal domain-containing protein n=3 Tax=Katanobacteria TaxID=422282 RepID=A0A1F4W3W8_UNCKA|nr:MAG: Parvulin-like protein peptidyl-prolyl isomerase [candidate division WWE3 bacterium GW2011_GWC2_41_23]KKS10015.1 MAG: Parvulin-like protein peptidyl-prolyl isomerase [candidate division WWE3 bacterium GW2011_GWF2_41_45]KKS11975.1 MAG: Parvulin-like protein peptidyl-prolyl isomerase [candidate division WWE3 bacterium GW2011_GWF1_41_53]KKS19865.1 MAG: Parvulin-like protein peptidyl-prolyl isomerase [candidate division WWE3 bacterium GW2011_GWE1_41_72]KKS28046.1 MAG: parvulin-like protein p